MEPCEPRAAFGAGAAESAPPRGTEGEGCGDKGTRGCVKVCAGLGLCVEGFVFVTCRGYRRS